MRARHAGGAARAGGSRRHAAREGEVSRVGWGVGGWGACSNVGRIFASRCHALRRRPSHARGMVRSVRGRCPSTTLALMSAGV